MDRRCVRNLERPAYPVWVSKPFFHEKCLALEHTPLPYRSVLILRFGVWCCEGLILWRFECSLSAASRSPPDPFCRTHVFLAQM